ncbi:MAG: RNA-binding S4 domain-containing protein [Magnetococcales bacterium]|nr:RNA-binding S4 domain-containing protein [Magnetococcales bacterium]
MARAKRGSAKKNQSTTSGHDAITERARLDKWLWAARFFKTRAIASDEVNGGKVHLNGARTKPGKGIKVGDRLEIRKGFDLFDVTVQILAERRVSATAAQTFYEESEQSRKAREKRAEQRRLQPKVETIPGGRPTKRDRRRMGREQY